MSRKIIGQKVYDIFICAALICTTVALCLFPSESVQAARDGLTLCGNVIIPSLFPFFVLSNITVSLGFAKYLGKLLEPIMRPLFNVSGDCAAALMLGFVGGYPVGARTALSLYENGNCSKAEAERLLSFCNNSGPAFVLGVVGAGIFSSSKIGLILYLVHFLASIVVGIIFRGWGRGAPGSGKKKVSAFRAVTFSKAFVDSVKASVQSTVNICGFVIFFTVLIRMLFLSGIIPALSAFLGSTFAFLGFDSDIAESLLTGIIEISSGVWSLKGIAINGAVAMASFMLGWAGISVHFQTLSLIGDSDLSVKSYILGKFCHGGISALLVFLFIRIYPLDSPVSAYLVEQLHSISSMDFSTSIFISTLLSVALCVGFIIISGYYVKMARKSNSHRL